MRWPNRRSVRQRKRSADTTGFRRSPVLSEVLRPARRPACPTGPQAQQVPRRPAGPRVAPGFGPCHQAPSGLPRPSTTHRRFTPTPVTPSLPESVVKVRTQAGVPLYSWGVPETRQYSLGVVDGRSPCHARPPVGRSVGEPGVLWPAGLRGGHEPRLDHAARLAVRSGGAGQLHGQRSDPPVTPDMSAEIVHPLQDEEWGVRRFFIAAPTAG